MGNYEVLERWKEIGQSLGKLLSFGKVERNWTENGKITKFWKGKKKLERKWENDEVLERWKKIGQKMGKL